VFGGDEDENIFFDLSESIKPICVWIGDGENLLRRVILWVDRLEFGVSARATRISPFGRTAKVLRKARSEEEN
jgi:hypothetical protein